MSGGWLAALQESWRASWQPEPSSPGAYRRAWLDGMLADHGFLRRFWTNRGQIDEGVYRENQPSPRRIRQLAAEGIRTIINLRGPHRFGSYAVEERACAEAGIELVNFRMSSRGLPAPEQIHALKAVFDDARRPMVIHCKSGADRAGIASALYVLLIRGGTIEEAQQELSFRYLHLKQARTGVLDHFLEAYRQYNLSTPTPFLEWVDTVYDPVVLKAEFKPKGWADLLVGGLLRRE